MGDRWRRAREWVTRHPLLTVAAVGLLVAMTHVNWVGQNRPPGTLNTDEAGYIALAMRLERAPSDGWVRHPTGWERVRNPWLEAKTSTSGPLVPALSAGVMTAGGRSTTGAMVVQPLVHAGAAVGAAGIALALGRGNGRRALVAGLVVLGLPVVVLSSRSYQLAGGVACALALALWALLASDRGRRTAPMVGFGVAVGFMLLSRTMAVTFLPGIVVATGLCLERSRRSLGNAVAAVLAAVLVAGPWWYSAWQGVTGYLVQYGYGDLAGAYGGGGLGGRVVARLDALRADIRLLLLIPAVVLMATALLGLRSRLAAGSRVRTLASDHRSALAVAAVVVIGYGVLLTSQNAGIWFELPLEVLLVPLVVSLSPLVAPRPRAVLGAVAVGAVAVNLVGIGRLAQGGGEREGLDALASTQMADMYSDRPILQTDDPDLLIDRAARYDAGTAWWRAHRRVGDLLEHRRPNGESLHLTIVGSSAIMNHNSILLSGEDQFGSSAGGGTADTRGDDLSEAITPWQGDSARVLVVIRTVVARPFPIDVGAGRLLRQAAEAGWDVDGSVTLPDGGSVTVLTHPDSIDRAPLRR